MTVRSLIALLALGLPGVMAASCPAQAPTPPGPSGVRLAVRVGWGDSIRPGRWAPLTVLATSPMPRAAVVEVYARQGGADAMRARQFLTLGPVLTAVPLYVPIPFDETQAPTVFLRDEATGKTLAHWPADPSDDSFSSRLLDGPLVFIGVSGRQTAFQGLAEAFPAARFAIDWLEPDLLPAAAVGYDALDVLVLNRPDLLHLGGDRQQALVDWVGAGGNLILWPGEDPAPRAGPLIDALPCRIGGVRDARISDDDLTRLGLARRFAGLRGRRLEPTAGGANAEPVPLFGPSAGPGNFAWRRRLGLGCVLVSPVDLSELKFDDPAHAAQFWKSLLAGTFVLPAETGGASPATVRSYGPDEGVRRRDAASRRVESFLGPLPAGEPPSFPDAAVLLLGMAALAGPVDGLVLRLLGRRPWTPATTAAWLALLVGGSLYLGRVFKAGRVSFGSVRVIDQADDGTAAETSLTCIAPARTAEFHLIAAPAPADAATQSDGPAAAASAPAAGADEAGQAPPGWWSAVGDEDAGPGRGVVHDLSFHQTDRGNAPDPIRIDGGDARYLRGDAARPDRPWLEARLAFTPGGPASKPARVRGVIHNLSALPLTHVRVRAGRGVTPAIDRIEAGESATVDADAGPADPLPGSNPAARSPGDGTPPPAADLWRVAGDLAGNRSVRIDALLDTGRFACVYAECPGAAPPALLREPATEQKHYALIRAVVRVNAEGEGR